MVLGLILGILYLFTDLFYWTKWAASYVTLSIRKLTNRRRFDLYDYEVKNIPEKLGVVVPEEETVLESPFSEDHLYEAADEILLYGVNSKSEVLVVRISRGCEDLSEGWIYLKLADGRRFQLLETSGHQRNHGGKCTSFSCGGLQIHYLIPMRRWRITYCGMLRQLKHDDEEEKEAVFVKFAFVWTASSEVYDFTSDLDIRPTAKGMANAKWISPYPPIERLSETFNFYAQCGVIDGTVSIEDQDDVEMYLFGERTRHIGKSAYVVGCKFKHVLGFVPESGLLVHLGRASVPNTFKDLPFGFIVHPRGSLYVIEDGLIISNMSETSISGTNLTAMFKAEKQYELIGNFVGDGVRFRSDHGWNGYFEMREIEFKVGELDGRGLVVLGEVHNLPERKVKKIPPVFPSAKPLTVIFTDEISHLAELTGGKGSSLGKLTKLSNQMKSFVVPKGIIVTTVAYTQFLTPEIIRKIENLKDVVYGNVEGNKEESCRIVSSAIERAYLSDTITKDIEEELNLLFRGRINHRKFAVRSSATGEDTEQMSAAGQMETFLGVQGLKEIFTAVKKCWASQFTNIAVEYKRQNGQILNSPMAVVIQEMVDCDSAGVLFTCDPVTNNPSVIAITGNYGLGESVVSGSEDPDTIILKKLPNEDVEIKSITIGMKQHKIIVPEAKNLEGQETVTEDVPEEKRNECCISKEMTLQLGRLSLKIENYYKSPRDIEWGIRNGTIYILQSRPVTTGIAASDYEIKHEFDGPLRCEGEYFTICNVGEVMPGATSPLGLEVVNKYFALTFMKQSLRDQVRNDFSNYKYYPIGILPFYNHMMMDVMSLLTRTDNLDSTDCQSMMMGVFGRILDDPYLKVLEGYRDQLPIKAKISSIFEFGWNLFFSGVGLEKVQKDVFSFKFPIEKCRTSMEIFDAVVHRCSDNCEAFIRHVNCTMMSSLWNTYMVGILGKAKGDIDTEVYSDFAKLLASSASSSADVESVDVPAAMQILAQWIVKDIKSEEFKAMSVEQAQEWLETSSATAGIMFRKFIERHGHRCLKEFDMLSKPWSKDPKPLIKLLQSLSGAYADNKEKKEDDVSAIISNLNVPLNFVSRLLIRFILPQCRRGVRLREFCKSNLIKAFDNARTGYYYLSEKMVTEGYLPDNELMFFMTIDEIKDLLHSRNPRLIARANHRRKLFPELDKLLFPDIMKGRPVPINEKEEEPVEYIADLTMKGTPVSQGTVKAYARVALTLDEASDLKPGEILITHGTDIGWSPYFPILSGVVTELGGLISHGAVISREYGLPCVVGLQGATRNFRTGDYVLLDGNKGIIQRLSSPEN